VLPTFTIAKTANPEPILEKLRSDNEAPKSM
jgi:hypothetical protein